MKIDPKLINKAKNIDNEKVTNTFSKRTIFDDILEYEISEGDDLLVITIKNVINEKKIKKSVVYDVFGREKGYNMIYSLSKNTSMAWSRVMDWCNILQMRPIISFESL